MPAGTAGSPWGVPGRLAGLGALPQGEVPRVAFGSGITGVVGRTHLVEPLAGQFPVGRVGADVEVHIPAGRVRVATIDEPLHQPDHLGHVPGGPRLDVRLAAAESVIRAGEKALVTLGDRPPGHAFLLAGPDYLVVDIGDIPAEGHLVTARLQ